MRRIWGPLISWTIILTSFQNCGKHSTSGSGSNGVSKIFSGAVSTCEKALPELYRTTYYPLLTGKCISCHTNGPGIGKFGHPDLTTSYNAFRSIGRTKIDNQAVNAAHNPPYTGAVNQTAINNFKTVWTQAEADVKDCEIKSGFSEFPVITKQMTDPKIVANASNQSLWVKLIWDMDLNPNPVALRIPLIVTIEARVAVIGGIQRGYEFRNPTAKLKSGAPVVIDGISVIMNGYYQTDMTVYEKINFLVNSTTEMNMAPGYAYGLVVLPPSATDKISLMFDGVYDSRGKSLGVEAAPAEPSTPPPTFPPTTTTTMPAPTTTTTTMPVVFTTFAELISTDPAKGVFKNSCLGCHSGPTPRAGLDLSNYTQAKANAAEIVSRTMNPDNPMPPTGLLPPDKQTVIQNWVKSGAPP
ncbi:MAG: hypothetical protein V4736_07765 [Bdellovibrionota bacterium]